MSRHAGPPRAADAPSIPEPTFAERARTLAYLGLTGALATLSRRHPGHPFASVMPYALDDAGAPLFLISTMAMHTQNLEADARASLLITQPGWSGDPLAAARLTLMGEARRVPEATMVAVDRLGFKLRLRSGDRLSSARVAFPCEVTTAAQSREVLIAMLKEARAGR